MCGLWHGAKWTYVLWGGAYAAVFFSLESLIFKKGDKLSILTKEYKSVRIIRIIMMMLLFIPASLIFRSQDLNQMVLDFNRLFTAFNPTNSFKILGMNYIGALYIILSLTAMFVTSKYVYKEEIISIKNMSVNEFITKFVAYTLIIVIIGYSWTYLLSLDDLAGFAYFQF